MAVTRSHRTKKTDPSTKDSKGAEVSPALNIAAVEQAELLTELEDSSFANVAQQNTKVESNMSKAKKGSTQKQAFVAAPNKLDLESSTQDGAGLSQAMTTENMEPKGAGAVNEQSEQSAASAESQSVTTAQAQESQPQIQAQSQFQSQAQYPSQTQLQPQPQAAGDSFSLASAPAMTPVSATPSTLAMPELDDLDDDGDFDFLLDDFAFTPHEITLLSSFTSIDELPYSLRRLFTVGLEQGISVEQLRELLLRDHQRHLSQIPTNAMQENAPVPSAVSTPVQDGMSSPTNVIPERVSAQAPAQEKASLSSSSLLQRDAYEQTGSLAHHHRLFDQDSDPFADALAKPRGSLLERSKDSFMPDSEADVFSQGASTLQGNSFTQENASDPNGWPTMSQSANVPQAGQGLLFSKSAAFRQSGAFAQVIASVENQLAAMQQQDAMSMSKPSQPSQAQGVAPMSSQGVASLQGNQVMQGMQGNAFAQSAYGVQSAQGNAPVQNGWPTMQPQGNAAMPQQQPSQGVASMQQQGVAPMQGNAFAQGVQGTQGIAPLQNGWPTMPPQSNTALSQQQPLQGVASMQQQSVAFMQGNGFTQGTLGNASVQNGWSNMSPQGQDNASLLQKQQWQDQQQWYEQQQQSVAPMQQQVQQQGVAPMQGRVFAQGVTALQGSVPVPSNVSNVSVPSEQQMTAVSEKSQLQPVPVKHEPRGTVSQMLDMLAQKFGLNPDDVKVSPEDYYIMRWRDAAEVAAEIASEQRQFYRKYLSNMRERCNVRPECTFENMQTDNLNRKAYDFANDFVNSIFPKLQPSMFLLNGDLGTGKTVLCHVVANRFLQLCLSDDNYCVDHEDVPFVAITTMEEIRNTRYFHAMEDADSRNQREQRFREFCRVDLLILDGLCGDSQALDLFNQRILNEILRFRSMNSKPMMITTPIDLPNLHRAVGDICFEGLRSFSVAATSLLGQSRRPYIFYEKAFIR